MSDRGALTAVMNRLEVDGRTPAAFGRLGYVHGLMRRRVLSLLDRESVDVPAWRQAPAFEVHVTGGLQQLLADPDCALTLRHVADVGEATGVVVFFHEPRDAVARMLLMAQGRLGAAFVAGRSLRHVSEARS